MSQAWASFVYNIYMLIGWVLEIGEQPEAQFHLTSNKEKPERVTFIHNWDGSHEKGSAQAMITI